MSEIKEKTGQIGELNSQLVDCQESLQNLVFQNSMQQLEDSSQIKKTRKKIARIKTLLTEAKASLNS
jgi:ribosomal protein L29